jgi:putative endonuclease
MFEAATAGRLTPLLPDHRRLLGDLGERLGVQHLLAKGYRIRERNFRVRQGEIDIVAERDDLLAFVEVRCRRGDAMGTAVESLSPAKQRRLLALADAYDQARQDLPEQRRIDLIAVDFAQGGRLLALQHVEGAVGEF